MLPLEMFRFTLKLYHEIITPPNWYCVSLRAFVQKLQVLWHIHTIKNNNEATKKREYEFWCNFCVRGCAIPPPPPPLLRLLTLFCSYPNPILKSYVLCSMVDLTHYSLCMQIQTPIETPIERGREREREREGDWWWMQKGKEWHK